MKRKKEIILFYAMDWDKASRKAVKLFKEIEEELSSKFETNALDVDTEFGAMLTCKYNVKNVPTTIIVENGKEIGRIKGFRNEEEYIKELKKW